MEHPAKIPVQFVQLRSEDICLELFQDFHRRQVVDLCWRKIDGRWQQKPDPFIDDWSQEDYAFLVSCLQNTVRTGGLVLGAFVDGRLKGFTSVEPGLFGKNQEYLDLSSIHVSEELRGQGVGRELIRRVKEWAKAQGARKLYISAHSAAETQAFYKAMGCVEAEEYNMAHAEKEPFDCQLECPL